MYRWFYIKQALKTLPELFSKDVISYNREMHGQDREMIVIDSLDTADWFGLRWEGKPFLHVSDGLKGPYDMMVHVFWVAGIFDYIASGQEAIDMCLAADDRLLSYAGDVRS